MKQTSLGRSLAGFTLVELIVVVAILALAASISFLGYGSFIQKAGKSRDLAFVAEINSILDGLRISEGNNMSPHDAMTDCFENGVCIDDFASDCGGSFLWDSVNDKFAYVPKGDVLPADYSHSYQTVNFFRIYSAYLPFDNSPLYSAYLGEGALESEDKLCDITISTGLDAGNYKLLNITYDNSSANHSQVALFRTDSCYTSLTIKAFSQDDCDTVKHLGKLGALYVKENGENSYHESGDVVSSDISSGKIVVTDNAKLRFARISGGYINNNSNFTVTARAVADEEAIKEKSSGKITWLENDDVGFDSWLEEAKAEEQSSLHVHSFTLRITDSSALKHTASCTQPAEYFFSCQCGQISDTLSFTYGNTSEHSFGDWVVVKQSSCTENGTRTRSCSCGICETESLAATGHCLCTVSELATCTEEGVGYKKCSNCGYETEKVSIAPYGHSFVLSVTAEATCVENGCLSYTCSRCGYAYTETIPAHGHNYVDSVTLPSCVRQGYTLHTCSRCEDSYTDSHTAPSGHTEVTDAAVEANCSQTGLTEGKHCSVCNEILSEQLEVAQNNKHDWVAGVCSRCNASRVTSCWKQVTDVSQLCAGDEIVLAADNGFAVTDNGQLPKGCLPLYEAAVNGDTVEELPATALIFTLGKNSDSFSLYFGGNYLVGNADLQWQSDETYWTVSIENGYATVQYSAYNIVFDRSRPGFAAVHASTASSDCILPKLYKKSVSCTEHTTDQYESDLSCHWKTCSVCNTVTDKEKHIDDNEDNLCDKCSLHAFFEVSLVFCVDGTETISPENVTVYLTSGGESIAAGNVCAGTELVLKLESDVFDIEIDGKKVSEKSFAVKNDIKVAISLFTKSAAESDWIKVTDETMLSDGDNIVIAVTTSEGTFVMTSTDNAVSGYTFFGSGQAFSEAMVMKLAKVSDNVWQLSTSGGYISSEEDHKLTSSTSASDCWTISFDNGVATLTNQKDKSIYYFEDGSFRGFCCFADNPVLSSATTWNIEIYVQNKG